MTTPLDSTTLTILGVVALMALLALAAWIGQRRKQSGRLQRAVEGTRHTLCVLTDHYVQSDWTTFENAMAQSMDPAAIERKVIPLMLVKCKLPLRLRMLHYRDLTTNDPQQWDLLYRDLM